MNQCFQGPFAENDQQSTGLYSPTHSFHIEWLLNQVPTNNTLSHRYTHNHNEFAYPRYTYCKPVCKCFFSTYATWLHISMKFLSNWRHVCTEMGVAWTHTKTCAYTCIHTHTHTHTHTHKNIHKYIGFQVQGLGFRLEVMYVYAYRQNHTKTQKYTQSPQHTYT